jgi:hypothetical protein
VTVTVTALLNGVPVPLLLDGDALAAIAAAVAAPQAATVSWLYGDRAAATYLGWPLGRVQKLSAAGLLPCHRVGQRKAYRTDELDAALADC